MATNFVLFLFPGYLAKAKADLTKNPGKAQINRPTLLRSLFTLGLLCKQFDFDSDVKPKNEVSISQSDCIFFPKSATLHANRSDYLILSLTIGFLLTLTL